MYNYMLVWAVTCGRAAPNGTCYALILRNRRRRRCPCWPRRGRRAAARIRTERRIRPILATCKEGIRLEYTQATYTSRQHTHPTHEHTLTHTTRTRLRAAARIRTERRIRPILATCSKKNMSHTQTHDQNNTIDDHAKNHPPHLTTIEEGFSHDTHSTARGGEKPNRAQNSSDLGDL